MKRLVHVAIAAAAVMAVAGSSALTGTASAVTPVTTSPTSAAPVVPVVVRPDNTGLVYLGRWRVQRAGATTVSAGSRVAFAFSGTRIALTFDRTGITKPAQIWTSLDGARPVLHTITSNRIELAPRPLKPGRHVLEVAVKAVDQWGARWKAPLRSALVIKAFVLSPGATVLKAPTVGSRRILFLGDSITEGIKLVGPDRGPAGADSTRAYPSLLASTFRSAFQQVGYGGQGITRGGVGGVPSAALTLTSVMDGVPTDPAFAPDLVVVNYGTNDVNATEAGFGAAYAQYLSDVRTAHPAAMILALRPFVGRHAAAVQAAVTGLADTRIRYVDTTGWLTRSGLTDSVHPNAAGHATVTGKLTSVIAKQTGWKPSGIRWTALTSR